MERIEIGDIKWIKKTKPKTENLVIGTVLVSAGTALLINVLAGSVDFDKIAPQGGAGIGLIAVGVAIVPPKKYKLYKGDEIVFKE